MAFWCALCRVAALLGVVVAAVPLLALQSQPTARAAPASPPARGFTWPLIPTPPVLRTFEPPTQRWLPGHRGVDLAATSGATVYSAGDGVVHFAGPVAGKFVVSIRHPDGLLTTYEPVKSSVRAGTPVVARRSVCSSPAIRAARVRVCIGEPAAAPVRRRHTSIRLPCSVWCGCV